MMSRSHSQGTEVTIVTGAFLCFLSSPSIRTVIQEIDEHQISGGGWLDRVFTDDGSLDRGNNTG